MTKEELEALLILLGIGWVFAFYIIPFLVVLFMGGTLDD